MPKMKTHKGLLKRVKVSARGKIRYKRRNAGHLMSGKPGKRMRKLRRPGFLTGADGVKARRALLMGVS